MGYLDNGLTAVDSVVNYPIFSGLNFIGGLSSITITRKAVFRSEYAP